MTYQTRQQGPGCSGYVLALASTSLVSSNLQDTVGLDVLTEHERLGVGRQLGTARQLSSSMYNSPDRIAHSLVKVHLASLTTLSSWTTEAMAVCKAKALGRKCLKCQESTQRLKLTSSGVLLKSLLLPREGSIS